MTVLDATLPAGRPLRMRLDHDAWVKRAIMAVIGLYLVVALALPLYTMLSKSFTTYSFDLSRYEFQVDDSKGNWSAPITAAALNEKVAAFQPDDLDASSDSRLAPTKLFPDFSFRSPVKYRIRGTTENAPFLVGLELKNSQEWVELDSNTFRRVNLRPVASRGLANYINYFSSPALVGSIANSLFIAVISTIVTIAVAFGVAYALNRSCMPFKGFFKLAMVLPILVPSLLPGIALIYLFGNQGIFKDWLFGVPIYGPLGIIIGSVFFTLPHALIIISTALAISDQRHYEAAESLRASRWRTFWTVTVPGARYGLISAAFVVFTMVITDFGLPKVIGGQFNVLAVDIYKQVIGQQNFEMGAVVSVVLLIPAVFAFVVDRIVHEEAGVAAHCPLGAVPAETQPPLRHARLCLVHADRRCSSSASWRSANMRRWSNSGPTTSASASTITPSHRMDGGGWASYTNSIVLASLTALFGTIIVFIGAYMVEKTEGFAAGRGLFHFLAMLPMAVPGLVLGLAYIFFFNSPSNPLHFLYGTMAILVICTVTHFYTVAHLTALTALKQMDREFEPVAASLTPAIPQAVPARHGAGLPAGGPGYLHLSLRQRDDDGVGGGVPLFRRIHNWRRWRCSTWTTPATSRRRRRWA